MRLSNQICFLVYRMERALMAVYRPLLAPLGLTYPQYLVMLALWEHGPLSVGSLCELLGLDTGTVSPLVKRLQNRGFVCKERKTDDERSVVVGLLPPGHLLKERARAIPSTLAACFASIDTESGYEGLHARFAAILQNLNGPKSVEDRVKPQ